MTTKEFLETLKAGDYIKTTGRTGTSIEKVVKITATQIVTRMISLDFLYRYRKSDGKRLGSGYIYYHYISDKKVSEAEKQNFELLVAEEIRMDAERKRVDLIAKEVAAYLAAQLNLPAEKISVYVQSEDGLKTVTWNIKVIGIPEENVFAMLAK